jgi:hypothetical protein
LVVVAAGIRLVAEDLGEAIQMMDKVLEDKHKVVVEGTEQTVEDRVLVEDKRRHMDSDWDILGDIHNLEDMLQTEGKVQIVGKDVGTVLTEGMVQLEDILQAEDNLI